MIRTQIQLTEEQHEALKELAENRETSMARLIRESVDRFLATSKYGPTREEKRQRALAFIKEMKEAPFRDKEGATDVSVNHDKYLDEIYGSW